MPSDKDIRKTAERLAKIIAVLVADGNYTYVDKLANAPSVDLAMLYLREAIRDFHSILRQGRTKNKKAEELLKKVAEEIKKDENAFDHLNRAINTLYEYSKGDPKRLREINSLIGAKALAISAKYLEEKTPGGER